MKRFIDLIVSALCLIVFSPLILICWVAPIYGNVLYENILRQVISDAMEIVPCKDVNLLLDSCRFITINRLKEVAYEEAAKHGVNVKTVNKVQSEHNKCIQLVDFIAGASRAMYENNDNTIEILRDKISIARRR